VSLRKPMSTQSRAGRFRGVVRPDMCHF
jgi:hypothetical protein